MSRLIEIWCLKMSQFCMQPHNGKSNLSLSGNKMRQNTKQNQMYKIINQLLVKVKFNFFKQAIFAVT